MIQKLPGFSLEMIEGKPYLLPYGQNYENHRRGMPLDQTGLFIWNTLDEVSTENELFFRFAAHKSLGVSEFQDGKKELENFLLDLEDHGFLLIDERRLKPETHEPFYKGIRIAGLRIKLFGQPAFYSEAFDRYIDMSVVEPSSADLTVVVTRDLPPTDSGSAILVRTPERMIAENDSFFTFFYPSFDLIREVRLEKNGSIARIYLRETADEHHASILKLKEQIFQILRTVYLYPASQKRIFALFSTGILYQNRIWLLCGSTKSFRMQLAKLWNACYGATILNTDLNLIGRGQDEVQSHSIPWGGSTRRYETGSTRIGGIILLKKDDHNHVMTLRPSSRILQVARHMLSPNWTQAQLHYQYVFTEELLESLPVWKIGCTVSEPAVELLKTEIDRLLFGS